MLKIIIGLYSLIVVLLLMVNNEHSNCFLHSYDYKLNVSTVKIIVYESCTIERIENIMFLHNICTVIGSLPKCWSLDNTNK